MDTASILVTGGTGLQGSHIVERLLEEYPRARIAVMARNPAVNNFPGVTYHAGDITAAADVARVLAASKPDVVFHCAGLLTISRKPVPDEVTWAINYEGARLVLEASQAAGVKAFVYTSSASVVMKEDGGFRDLVNADETYPTVDEDDDAIMYAKSKSLAERLVLAADSPSTPGGMRTTALRPALLFGERDTDIIPSFLASLRAGRTGVQIGDNTNRMAVTYVTNAADAHIAAARILLLGSSSSSSDPAAAAAVAAANRVGGEAFFVTNDDNPRFWDFTRAVWAAAGTTVDPASVRVIGTTTALWFAWAAEWVGWLRGVKPSISRPIVRVAQMNRWYNVSKARERLGYVPRVTWEDGVQRGVKWYLDWEKTHKA